MMEAPHNYRLQNGCHNCQHCFVELHPDGGDNYWCKLDAPPRPPCGSFIESEEFADETAYNKWIEWSNGRERILYGICDEWEQKE